jgi:glycosyltransferase involved in cell wall biosynthesis
MLNHKLTFPFADRIIGNSKSGLEAYNAPTKKSGVIYNGFDFQRISKLRDTEVIRKMYHLNGKFIVGMVASFAARKDYGTFMKAINELVDRDDEFTFLCIGDGDKDKYRDMLTEKAAACTLFLDHQDEVESIMQICDVGVLTTITEGIPNSILEFMALGKPVVVAGGGGCGELISQGKNGFLLGTGDYNGVMDKLLFLKGSPEIRADFGRESRSIVEEKFSMSVMVDRYLEEYNRYV